MLTDHLSVTRHRSVNDIAGAGALFEGASLFDSPDWLRYCERLSGHRMTYLVARDFTGAAVGLTATRTIEPGQVMALYDLGTLFDGWKPAALYPNVVSAVSGSHFVDLVHPGADASAVRTALGGKLIDTAAEFRCQTAAALYLENFQSTQQLAHGMDGSPPFIIAAQTLMAGSWSNFDEYLSGLKRSRRNKVRREFRDCQSSGVRISVHHGTASLDERTARLQLALREKYSVGGSLESVLTDYDNLAATVDDKVIVFLAEYNGQPIGMSLALREGDRLHLRLVGFDYRQVPAFLYFNVLFYAPIEWGSANGIASYAFGTGSYAAKLARGCIAQPLYAAVRWPERDREACEARCRSYEQALIAEVGLGNAQEIA